MDINTRLFLESLQELQLQSYLGIFDITEDKPINILQNNIDIGELNYEFGKKYANSKPKKISAINNNFKAVSSGPAVFKPSTLYPSEANKIARQQADNALTLEDLHKSILSFEHCDLKYNAQNTVFADGNPAAKIMLIGEAPGENEDIQGIPFCGKSGMLLDKAFASIGLDRAKNLYITNTIFWRPPENRTPEKHEVEVCLPFLEKHIALINPDLIVCVGSIAINALLPKQTIGKIRSTIKEYNNIYSTKNIAITAIFHPAYMLRNPSSKKLTYYDLLEIRKFLDNN